MVDGHDAWEPHGVDDEVTAAHEAALRRGEDHYVDPRTGYQVFTSAFLAARGNCCDSGCRHCPYGSTDDPVRSADQR